MTADSAGHRLDIAALHAAYAAKTLTPSGLVAHLYARMDQENEPGIWITRVDERAALARAAELGDFPSDGLLPPSLPLFGIPFVVKDNVDVRGLPTTAACPAYSYLPEESSPAVQALVDAGAICLGKVNLDQFATGLVGTRSPYGACRNVFNPLYLSGGSSSGSAVAVARHYVSFGLGTDTAGSGRVPAALNNIVGLKPSVGLFPSRGMVPACASLDCLSVFALSVEDAVQVRNVITGHVTAAITPRPLRFRFGVPKPLEFYGDDENQALFERSLARLEALGGERVEVDFAPLAELGDMLYGPFVVERLLGVGDFIDQHGDTVLPVTRDIILGGKVFSAKDAFRAFQRLNQLRSFGRALFEQLDYLVTPTVPKHFTLAEDQAEPRAVNDKLGVYTRFVNFIGCPVLAVPQAFRADGLPFGISLLTAPQEDARLDTLASLLHRQSEAGMGRRRDPLAPNTVGTLRLPPPEARLAVVGAHMRGLALNQQLLDVRARYIATVRSAPKYRLYVLPTKPERPGLVQVPELGASVEIELWDVSWHGLGELLARVPAPLAIGTLETDDGERVKGFLCESYAVLGARDITELGGYRAYAEAK